MEHRRQEPGQTGQPKESPTRLMCVGGFIAPRRGLEMGKTVPILIFVGLLLSCSASPPVVYANAGPSISISDGDAAFFLPVRNEFIEVASEDLAYDIKVSGQDEAHAEIRATYELRNTSPETVTALVAFVANNPSTGVLATIDGEPVEVRESKVMPWNVTGAEVYVGDTLSRRWSNVGLWTPFGVWEPTFDEMLRFMGTGERTGDTNAGYDFELSLFELSFPAGSTRTFSVSYAEKAAVIRQRKGYKYVNPVAEFYYFLEPARYWGSFSDLAVTITAPGRVRVQTSLDGFRCENNVYTAHFDSLPEQNLRIAVELDPPGVARTIARAFPWAVAIAAVLGIFAFAKRARKARKAQA